MRAADWRLGLVAGAAAGLLLSPFLALSGGWIKAGIVLLLTTVVVVSGGQANWLGLGLIATVALLVGVMFGNARLETTESKALRLSPGAVTLSGHAAEPASGSRGTLRFEFDSKRGRVLVETTSNDVRQVKAGTGLEINGRLDFAPEWQRSYLKRRGIFMVLRATAVKPNGISRAGFSGLVDKLRNRAFEALDRQVPQREAALSRGFVLGDDSAIDRRTGEDFRRSGLSHLMAASGQNIVLLTLLATPFLGLLGLSPRGRLLVIGGLILLYVPLAGGGPSIQRAGVMGIAGLVAIGATSAPSRIYALGLAALVTLAIDPHASGDIGWQLSFAAVIGIMLLARPLQQRLEPLIGEGGWRGALTEGMAVTIAATVATTPLTAFHFEQIPLTTVVANLLAMPAVAPAMWTGMISITVGQVAPPLAVPFNLVGSVALAWIAQVAAWMGRPTWAVFEVKVPGIGGLAAISLLLSVLLWIGLKAWPTVGVPGRQWKLAVVAAALVVAAVAVVTLDGGRRQLGSVEPQGARIELLDIGQGDAILVRPWRSDPILIDGGPPGGDITGALDSAGVQRLAAVILTHADLDHYGGLSEVFGLVPVDHLLIDQAPPEILALARRNGVSVSRVDANDRLAAGNVHLDLLWPPDDPVAETAASVTEGDNDRSVVALLSWRGFRMLLTGDAEAESVPIDPGPIDVLKVAHHGSEDTGLPGLLDRAKPGVALISVGEDNRFGHPVPEVSKAFEIAGVREYRTDQDGTVSVVLKPNGEYQIETGR